MGISENVDPVSYTELITPVQVKKEHLYLCLRSQNTVLSFKMENKKTYTFVSLYITGA